MAHLGQVKHFSSLQQGLLNSLATAFAACLAHAVQDPRVHLPTIVPATGAITQLSSSSSVRRRAKQQIGDEESGPQQYGFGSSRTELVFSPCVECTCLWISLLWILLAGITPSVDLKDKCQKLIAFVLGLAMSVQASCRACSPWPPMCWQPITHKFAVPNIFSACKLV